MKYLAVGFIMVFVYSCSYKNIGEYGPNTVVINFGDLPDRVKEAYQVEFEALKTRKIIYPITIINLDSLQVKFIYIKSTSVEIVQPGKKIYKIGGRRFYIPWNSNREMHPRILYKRKIYMVYTTTEEERINYDLNDNFKNAKYLKVDLNQYLNY